jgi:predicted Zn-dependent peptidase
MKTLIRKSWVAALMLLLAFTSLQAQKTYPFKEVPNDPLKARVYTLANGLTVYLTVYKDAPRIQTAIAVRTGSKNDPSYNTGLSHYLEHMMFKGTQNFGTIDYAAEKPYLDQVDDLFETYKVTTDPMARKAIYHQIDSISNIASKYAIANEYDKLLAVIGAKGTNAFTGYEETVYINDIPSNKVQPWVDIEFERFRDPVFRLFHTELETVYEEKNISMDTDDEKVNDSLFGGLFPNNTYGTQSVIGTVAHLKNPSLKSLKEYYASRYVPNNMAILMSGDFNPDEVIALIDKSFGTLQQKPVTQYVPKPEKPIAAPIVKEVVGPDAESVNIGFRLGGVDTPDADYVTLFSKILSNGTAGLIDLNLNQAQKVLEAGADDYALTEFSVAMFYGKAKQGQSLEEVKDLILGQIDLVKKGNFPDWMIPAIINNMKLQRIRTEQTNQGRVFSMLDGFIQMEPRQRKVDELDRLSKISKADLVAFANKNFGDNYVIVYKRTGTAVEPEKVVKPEITPVTMNRDSESAFLKKIMAEPCPNIEPVFLNYDKDITRFSIKQNIPVLYVNNTEDGTFSLTYYFTMGTNADKTLGTALDYLQYLGTSKYTPSQIQEEFYKLACSFNAFSSTDEVRVTLTGLTENMDKGLTLFEHLLADCQPNPEAWQNMISDIQKRRADDKLNKGTILWSAMYNYGVYGEKSPFTNILSDSDLKAIQPEELVKRISSLEGYEHKILYYGPMPTAQLTSALNKGHNVPSSLKPVLPNNQFKELDNPGTKVYTVDYDMKQVEIVMLSKSDSYDPKTVPVIRLFNEYFGGSMNSVVFQEIRESKGLAYSAYGGYRSPSQPWQHYYVFSYIGTQNDKLPEAMKTMLGIFNSMPESDKALGASKDAIINKIRTERITKGNIIFNYLSAQRFGLNYDIRKSVFEKVPAMNITDLKAFQEKYIKDKQYTILVLGNKDLLDMKTLEGYGKVAPLTLENVFGY